MGFPIFNPPRKKLIFIRQQTDKLKLFKLKFILNVEFPIFKLTNFQIFKLTC